MKKSDACLVSAVAGVLTLGAAVSAAAESTGPQTEMCFGYRLENSCGTNGSGCGGRALSRLGPVTVLLPGETVSKRAHFQRDGYQGLLVPVGNGAAAIVGLPGEPLGSIEARLPPAFTG